MCIFISVLFICTNISALSVTENQESLKSIEPTLFGGYFIFGFMKLIDPKESRNEFEIVSFVILFEKGDTIRLNQGEMIKINPPIFGIIFNNLFVGYIGDYSIIG